MSTYYTAYGLQIASELLLPELLPGSAAPLDVSIRLGQVCTELSNAGGTGGSFPALSPPFLLRVPAVADYLVVNGQDIWVEPTSDSSEADVRLFLLGSAFGALLHQRHILPMHASVVQTPRGAVLFVGPSGHGKSTLLAALLQRGYAMLADDVTGITLDAAGGAVALPALPYIRLWADAATKLHYSLEGLQRVRTSLDKYLVPAPRFCAKPLPIHAVYALTVHHAPDIRVESVENLQKFAVLASNTYRDQFLQGVGLLQSHFHLVAAMANSVPVSRISRPAHPFLLNDLVDRVEAELV